MIDPTVRFNFTQTTENNEKEFYIAIGCNNQQLFNELHKELDRVLTRYTNEIEGLNKMDGE